MFAQHSWYFRNALVRANYRNAVDGIDYAPEYLERFFRNLLLGERWDLRNRYLHIHPTDDWRIQPNLEVKPKTVEKNIETVEKSVKTVEKIIKILSNNPTTTVRELSEMLNLSRRGVEEQIKSLKQKGIIRRIGPDKGGHWQVISPLNPNL